MNKKLTKYLSFFLPTSKMRKEFRARHTNPPPLLVTDERSFLTMQKTLEKGRIPYTQSYAQFGEDRVIAMLMDFLLGERMRPLSYLEIGVCNPVMDNNTYLFYANGGRGVLVEPNPVYAEMIKRHRPDDIHVAAGLLPAEGKETAAYYDFGVTLSGLNTFSEERVAQLAEEGRIPERVLQLPVYTVNSLLEKYFSDKPLDLISLDIEGLDYELLATIDFERFRPLFFCVEADKKHMLCGREDKIIRHMRDNGYILVVDNFVNYIFVDRKRLENHAGFAYEL